MCYTIAQESNLGKCNDINTCLDIVRVQDLEMAGADDPTVLAWADQAGCILLTHDERTIPLYVYERLGARQTVAGVIVANDKLAIHTVIDDILLILDCSIAAEWINQIQRLPL